MEVALMKLRTMEIIARASLQGRIDAPVPK